MVVIVLNYLIESHELLHSNMVKVCLLPWLHIAWSRWKKKAFLNWEDWGLNQHFVVILYFNLIILCNFYFILDRVFCLFVLKEYLLSLQVRYDRWLIQVNVEQ